MQTSTSSPRAASSVRLRRSTMRLRAIILSSRISGGAASALPLERALADLVEQAEHEDENEEEDRAEDRDVLVEELAVDDDPGDEDHDLQVEEHEEERGDVELDREAGVDDALPRHPALVGGILDLGVLAPLAHEGAQADDERCQAGRDQGLDQEREVGGRRHRGRV